MTRTVAIVGPTAVGKTDLSLSLAGLIGGEIVNADSMQLYRGMDIGTAKIPLGERRGIAHHMLDVLDVTEAASAALYQQQARAAVAAIHSRGNVAIVVGGSGLFVDALLDDMRFPGGDADVRRELQAELERLGAPAMHERLAAISAQAAADILPTNGRRIVRALEVAAVTGQPPVTRLAELAEVVPALRIGLTRARTELDERIEARVESMWQGGLVEEVAGLEAVGLRTGLTASKALGYQQVLAALAGEIPMAQAKAETIAGTRRLVRRQEAWFKRDARVRWFAADGIAAADIVALRDLDSSHT